MPGLGSSERVTSVEGLLPTSSTQTSMVGVSSVAGTRFVVNWNCVTVMKVTISYLSLLEARQTSHKMIEPLT